MTVATPHPQSSLARNTCFALLSALEEDLRDFVTTSLGGDPLTPAEREIATRRGKLDAGGSVSTDWRELLSYLDLGQLLDVINRSRGDLVQRSGADLLSIERTVTRVQRLVPIRNRVCHSRPLEPDDLVHVLDASDELARENTGLSLTALSDIRKQLGSRNELPFSIAIPQFWRAEVSLVPNNLPAPEFDDTGFVGRRVDRENLGRHLIGAHPLITVTGEGGVGKTSLTLRCVHDLLEEPARFDAILWTSLKTTHLTVGGVRTVANALTSELDLLASVAGMLGPEIASDDRDRLFHAVLEVLGSMRVLLVIDNLETIDREALRPLFIAIPRDSKVVLTSRIGVGEIEIRYPLQPMTPTDAVALLRRTARVLNVGDIATVPEARAKEIAEALFFNPLAIRWFVQSFSHGRSIRDLLDHKRDLAKVLDFSFHRLYEALPDDHRRLLRVLVSAAQPVSEVQLALLADIRDIEVIRTAIDYLYSSNLITRASDSWGDGQAALWTVTPFARRFILSRDRDVARESLNIRTKFQQLTRGRREQVSLARGTPYRASVIAARNTDEGSVVRLLAEALDQSRRGQHVLARDAVERARRLLPNYFEVARVSAQVKASAGDVVGARQDFDAAMELSDGHHEPLLVHYARFLADQGEFDSAVTLLEPRSERPSAPPELKAAYAEMLAAAGQLDDSLAVFRLLEPQILEIDRDERVQYVRAYVRALEARTEVDAERGRADLAIENLIKIVQVAASATRLEAESGEVIRAAQAAVSRACSVLARTCSVPQWNAVLAAASELATIADPLASADDALGELMDACPDFTQSETYRALLEALGRHGLRTNERVGTVKPIPWGREFGFIGGDDGRDYFFHRNDVVAPTDWESLVQLHQPRVRFVPGDPSAPDRAAKARSVRLALGARRG